MSIALVVSLLFHIETLRNTLRLAALAPHAQVLENRGDPHPGTIGTVFAMHGSYSSDPLQER
jgi:hypothetical protein